MGPLCQDNLAIPATLDLDTTTGDFSGYDIVAAADPGATYEGFPDQEWTPSNTDEANGVRANSDGLLSLANDSGQTRRWPA
jgi:hypothetical protein